MLNLNESLGIPFFATLLGIMLILGGISASIEIFDPKKKVKTMGPKIMAIIMIILGCSSLIFSHIRRTIESEFINIQKADLTYELKTETPYNPEWQVKQEMILRLFSKDFPRYSVHGYYHSDSKYTSISDSLKHYKIYLRGRYDEYLSLGCSKIHAFNLVHKEDDQLHEKYLQYVNKVFADFYRMNTIIPNLNDYKPGTIANSEYFYSGIDLDSPERISIPNYLK